MKNIIQKITIWNILYLFGFGSFVTGCMEIIKYVLIFLEPIVHQYAKYDWLMSGLLQMVVGMFLT